MTDVESLTERLRAALQAVEAAEVPDDLREIAFTRALDATLGASAPAAAAPVAHPPPNGPTAPPAHQTATATTGTALAGLATKLGIDEATAARVYDIDDDGLHVVLSPSRFNGQVTYAMQEIARLVVAGRQAAGIDEDWTSVDEARKVCENRGRYSSSNFATQVKKLDGDGFRVRGTGRSRELKASAVGYERTGELVARLVQQE
jgi:hypothetical protein